VLRPNEPTGRPEAFLIDREFGHLQPPRSRLTAAPLKRALGD
jgi:hypothetical protein